MDPVHLVVGLVSALAVWLGFLEKRLQNLVRNFEERLKDKTRIHEVVQENLRKDIARLEAKIDMLIKELMSERTKGR